jgi:glycosyltransferase involved in cell wall biosynthesis
MGEPVFEKAPGSVPAKFDGGRMDNCIAYILKAYGRTSETFITNEISLLGQLGIRLRLFSLKRISGQQEHASLRAISAPLDYLPLLDDLQEQPFFLWASRNIPRFISTHLRLFGRCPRAYVRVLGEALMMGWRYRSVKDGKYKKTYFKEFLQAGYIAKHLSEDSSVTHIHAHFCHGATTVAMLAARLTGLPFSFTAHAKDVYLEELNPRDLLSLKIDRAAFVVTCTSANRQYLRKFEKHTPSKIRTIYHGLDLSLFQPRREQAVSPHRILSVGRLVEKKGFLTLVEACSLLRERRVSFECLIVGGADSFQPVVEERIRRLELSSYISIRSAVTQEELRDIYESSSVFVLACQVLENGDRDGIPNVLAEAMAMQLPVVSTDISGIPELVRSGENGLLVPPSAPAELAAALQLLLEDAPLRQRLGVNARRTITEVFDSSENIRQLAELFQSGSEDRIALAETTRVSVA